MNKVLIVGNVGNVSKQDKFTSVSVATNESYKGKDGKWVQKAHWHNIVTFGKTAENVSNNIKKGDLVSVEGSLSYYEKDKVKYTNIIALNIKRLNKKDENTDPGPDSTSSDNLPF